ncbi:MAG TPA: hypothetical protein VMU41_04720 [Candidatus Binataceae bacterium]|nr:hypothetical protein [Candidatus Binataceae bacterium]
MANAAGNSVSDTLRNLWVRGGADIPPSVIRMLTNWDRSGGHTAQDRDYGKNVWDRLLIAGIWPLELLATGLLTLLIVTMMLGQRLNSDLAHFNTESWSDAIANLGEIILFGLAIATLMLLASYLRQALKGIWDKANRQRRIVGVIVAALVLVLAWSIFDLQQSNPNLALSDGANDWWIAILWRAVGYLAFAIMVLAGAVILLLLLATQGPDGAPRTLLRSLGGILRDLTALALQRFTQGGFRSYALSGVWILAVFGLLEAAHFASSSFTPFVTTAVLALIWAGLAWLTWPVLPTIVAVSGILLTIILVGISGTLTSVLLLIGWAVCLWRTISARSMRHSPGYLLSTVQWLFTIALASELFAVYLIA